MHTAHSFVFGSRNRLLRLAALSIVLATSLGIRVSATVIEPTTWYSAGGAGVVQPDGGIKFVTNGTTVTSGSGGIQHVLTYFTPVSLSSVGDSISVSLKFTTGTVTLTDTNAGRVIGFSFYDSAGNQISSSGLGQNNSLFTNYRGYRVGMSGYENSNPPFELRARSGSNQALGNTGTAHATSYGTGGPSSTISLISDTVYTVNYSITRVSTEYLSVSFSVTGGGLTGYSGSWTDVPANYTSFDMFVVILGSANAMTTMTLSDVSLSSIPEPASAATLVALGALVACVGLKRRF